MKLWKKKAPEIHSEPAPAPCELTGIEKHWREDENRIRLAMQRKIADEAKQKQVRIAQLREKFGAELQELLQLESEMSPFLSMQQAQAFGQAAFPGMLQSLGSVFGYLDCKGSWPSS